MSKKTYRAARRDVAQEVTDKIIAALENGTSPWQRPWRTLGVAGRGHCMPHNASTGRAYRGLNVSLLMIEQQARGYTSAGWLTYKQAQDLGGHVRKGEKGTLVVLWKFLERVEKDAKTGEESSKKFPMLRSFTVFNTEQCADLPDRIVRPEGEPVEPIPDLAQWVHETLGCAVEHGGDGAFYAPGPDMIRMPNRSQFTSEEGYNGTLLHEATHATGSRERLDRLRSAGFGSQDYAKEELVAEIGASMLCATLGLDYEIEHHASYIASWLKALRDDKKWVLSAASHAQKAVDYILDKAGMLDTDSDEAEENVAPEIEAAEDAAEAA